VAVFTTDVSIRRFADKLNNVVHWSEFGRGGHFAALEVPGLLTADVREFFGTLTAGGAGAASSR
jgi:epoxide hydrolase